MEEPRWEPQQTDGERTDPASKESVVIHLPALLADEFGFSRSGSRMMLTMGKLYIDGQLWSQNNFDIPRQEIEGKEIKLLTESKSVRFIYKPKE